MTANSQFHLPIRHSEIRHSLSYTPLDIFPIRPILTSSRESWHSMKKCSWCGAEYPDDVTLCPIDQNALANISPPALPKPPPGFIATLLSVRDDLQMDPASVPEDSAREFRGTFVNYICGLIVGLIISFVVSFAGFVLLAFSVSSPGFGFPGFCISLVVGGFLGTFLGTLCLPRGKRAFGSIALLFVGSALYVTLTICTLCAMAGDDRGLIWIIPAAIGGTFAVIFFNWGRRPKYVARPPAGQGPISKTSGTT